MIDEKRSRSVWVRLARIGPHYFEVDAVTKRGEAIVRAPSDVLTADQCSNPERQEQVLHGLFHVRCGIHQVVETVVRHDRLGSLFERPANEHLGQVGAVGDAGIEVGLRLGFLHRKVSSIRSRRSTS